MLTPSKLVHEHSHSPGMVRVLRSVLLLLSTSSFSMAQQPPRIDNGGRRGPPPGALSACESLNQSDVCSVETPRGLLNGLCQMARHSETLVCVPKIGLRVNVPPR